MTPIEHPAPAEQQAVAATDKRPVPEKASAAILQKYKAIHEAYDTLNTKRDEFSTYLTAVRRALGIKDGDHSWQLTEDAREFVQLTPAEIIKLNEANVTTTPSSGPVSEEPAQSAENQTSACPDSADVTGA